MDYSNRTYAFIKTSDLEQVDFSQVMERDTNTIRKSVDETQFIVKWYTKEWPSFLAPSGSITLVWSGSHEEVREQLQLPFWKKPDPIG